MTDEQRLHDMMADPGPAPDHDANGWPADELPPTSVLLDSMKIAWQRREDGNWQAIGGRLPLGGLPFYELDRRHDGDLTLIYMPGAIDLPPDELVPPYSAGSAAPSSASTSGTGGTGGTSLTTVGLADTAASLESSARALTRLAVNIRDEIEGRLSKLWQVLIGAARAAERVGGQDGYAQGLRYAYYLMTSMDGVALEKKIAAELDSRYGTDRAKGGEPRG